MAAEYPEENMSCKQSAQQRDLATTGWGKECGGRGGVKGRCGEGCGEGVGEVWGRGGVRKGMFTQLHLTLTCHTLHLTL